MVDCIKNLTNEEIIAKREHILQKNREAQKRFYDKNKNEIKQRKKECYKKLKQKYNSIINNEPINEPVVIDLPEPVVIDLPEPIITKTTKTKKTNKTTKSNFTIDKIIEGLNKLDINPNTKKKYIGDISTLMRITECNDLEKCLKKPNEIFKYLDEATTKNNTPYSINSKKGYIQSILFVVDKLGINLNNKIKNVYIDKFNSYKILSSKQSEEKNNDTIIDFNTYLDLVKTHYGENSKNYVISKLYEEVPVRDDFHLKIVPNDVQEENDTNNYLVIPSKITTKNKMVVVINEYKTKNLYGTLKFVLSKQLENIILKYIKENKLNIGDYLFGKQKSNSDFISKQNKILGITGSINNFRRMTINNYKNKNPDEIIKLNKLMGHSHEASKNYIRNIFNNTNKD
jgi:hypothetical protein